MKYALPLFLIATPALAHDGVHLHPHGSENWIAGAMLIGTCLFVAGVKYVLAKRAEQRT